MALACRLRLRAPPAAPAGSIRLPPPPQLRLRVWPGRGAAGVARASGEGSLGDFGARDPFPAELESNFCDKTLGLPDTEHKILLPRGLNDITGLAAGNCAPLEADAEALSEADARELLKRVVGWRLLPLSEGAGDSALKLQGKWRVRDEASGQELRRRISSVAAEEGQDPSLDFDDGSRSVVAELYSEPVGGLTLNDFVLAAKIDKLEIKDLVPKARFWA